MRRHDGETRLECGDGVGLGLPVAAVDGRGKVAVTLRPEHVNVSPEPGPGSQLEGVVRETYYLGAEQRLEVEVAPGRRIVAVRPAAARPPIDEGQTVRLGWDPEDVVVLAEAA